MADTEPSAFAFTHTRLLVADYEACFRFYRDVLGFEVSWGDESGVYADFDTGETTLALFDEAAMAEAVGGAEPAATETSPAESPATETPGNDVSAVGSPDAVTIVLEVESVDEMYQHLSGNEEIAFDTEPHDQPGWGIRVAHFRDPAGTLIEINEPLTE